MAYLFTTIHSSFDTLGRKWGGGGTTVTQMTHPSFL